MSKLKITAYTFALLSLVALPTLAKELPGRNPKVWPGYETENVNTRGSRPETENMEVRGTRPNKEQLEEKREELKAKIEEQKAKRCEIATNNVENVLTRAENNRDKHTGFVTQFKQNLDKLVSNLKDKGFDTTKLESYLAVLATKQSKLKTDYEAYIAKMTETKGFVCGNSEGAFVSSRKEARELFLVVRSDFEDIRNYFKDTIRPEIKALRESAKAKNESANTEENSQ